MMTAVAIGFCALVLGLLVLVVRAVAELSRRITDAAAIVPATVRREMDLEFRTIHREIAFIEHQIVGLGDGQQKLATALREVVLENPGNVDENDPGIVIRRVRGVRAALWRMEQESYAASLKEPVKSE